MSGYTGSSNTGASTTDAAKLKVQEFMAKAGHHDTTVDETVAPAVTHETIIKTKHEEITGAVDREVHQDHYHTSVQPIVDRAVVPEQHITNTLPVEVREHHHGDESAVRARLEQERAQFSDTRVVQEGSTTHSEAPVIAGEHRHHHVHEVIQPVIQREVIQPTVVHTVVPVHEVHHNAAKHHAASTLPAMSLAEFQSQGGSLSGREARHDGFEGEPRAVAQSTGAVAETERDVGSLGHHHHHGHHHGNTSAAGTGYDESTTGSGYGSSSTTGNKPTLKERMDPRIDADGDGKAGVMN